jgi:hypothetical protein
MKEMTPLLFAALLALALVPVALDASGFGQYWDAGAEPAGSGTEETVSREVNLNASEIDGMETAPEKDQAGDTALGDAEARVVYTGLFAGVLVIGMAGAVIFFVWGLENRARRNNTACIQPWGSAEDVPIKKNDRGGWRYEYDTGEGDYGREYEERKPEDVPTASGLMEMKVGSMDGDGTVEWY